MSRKKKEELTSDHLEHIYLAGFIKGVHAELRNKYKNSRGDLEQIWQEHCQNKRVLTQYADAMQRLATNHWNRNPETRIDWCRQTIHNYFRKDGLKKLLEKEERRKKYLHSRKEEVCTDDSSVDKQRKCSTEKEVKDFCTVCSPTEEKIMLLDVGSCFNPFSEFDEFDAVAIDISPAKESVYCCDFLKLKVTEPEDISFLSKLNNPVESLPGKSFHVVVFSLLLEYFPAPCQRWKCCQKAHELLKLNGILVIITPDSHKQHRNAQMMKNWKTAIESIGFRRWHYVKLEHLHCMVFTKTLQTEVLDSSVNYIDMLTIPQDLHNRDEDEARSNSASLKDDTKIPQEGPDLTLALLQELPLIDCSTDGII